MARRSILRLALISLVAALPALAVGAAQRDEADRALVAAVTEPTADFSKAEAFEARPGGAATSLAAPDRDAFSHSSANMTFERELDFKVGNGFFRKVWISAPASVKSSDGLGPLFNARACQQCHLKDGRGHPPLASDEAEQPVSMFLRLSVPPAHAGQEALLAAGRAMAIPDPVYGGQLQTFAIQGHEAEARLAIDYVEEAVRLADGTEVGLRHPTYRIEEPAYGPLRPDLMISPRVAPPVIGLGLVEAIPEEDILANADPDDADGDGISGRPNYVWDEGEGRLVLGRFGWKAGMPDIRRQSAAAFLADMGLSTSLFPHPYGECMEAQTLCRESPSGAEEGDGNAEVTDDILDLVTFYSRNLAVPVRRNVGDPTVLAGKRLFYESGCTGCHRPKFVTARLPDRPEQSFQLIWPYSDFLLHDMGEGLADHRPEGRADGREWRTPPLWGIGLTQAVGGHTLFLHDGRARSLLEAILWHGGEAEASRAAVVAMTKEEREALLAFLESL